MIRQRKDGRWEARVSIGFGTDGKLKYKAVYGKTRSEANRKMTEVKHNFDKGVAPTDDRLTVSQYLAQWLESVEERTEENTYCSYASMVRLHINPVIGRIKLTKLTPVDVERMMRASSTVKNGNYARRVLRAALGVAVDRGQLLRNVASMVSDLRIDKADKYEAQFLTLAQGRHLLAAVADDPLEGLYTVALALGMRKGEALGLMWKDIDLDNARIILHQQIQRSRRTRGLYLKDTKSHQVRALDLPAFAVAALRRHRARQNEERLRQGPHWHDTGHVFTTPVGTPIDASNLSRKFNKVLAEAGLPRIRWHELRHSAAALMLAQGATMQEVQAMLGHAELTVTMKYYGHLVPGALRALADRMDAAFGTDTDDD
jgi:integrase